MTITVTIQMAMTFIIHYTLADGSEDQVTLTGDSIAEIQDSAGAHLQRVGGKDPWSEEVK